MKIFNILTPQSSINCQEAYSIWDDLAAKGQFLEKLHIWQNFTHDKDLKKILNYIITTQKKIAENLEKKCQQFSLPGPEVGVKDANTGGNVEVIRDEIIAKDVFLWLQGILELVLRAIRITTTNDDLRSLFTEVIRTDLNLMDDLVCYLRTKGWINVPLRYPNIPKKTNEDLDAGEAFHLWDHLTFRYDNIHQTEICKDLAKDFDLKLLFTTGLQEVLKKQIEKLEKECLHFGIPLPKKPPNIVSWPHEAKHFVNDDYLYRVIFTGIVGATLLHIAAVKQSLTNDRIRKFFIELLFSEIEIQNKMIKYGKAKGYLNEPPQYAP